MYSYLPGPDEDCMMSFARPRILQMEKSVSGLLETGARIGGSGNDIRDPLACAERTRTSISAATELNWLHSISTTLMHLLHCATQTDKEPT